MPTPARHPIKRGSASGWRGFFPNGPGLAKRFIWNPIESRRVERMAGPKVVVCRWRSASRWSLRPKRFGSQGQNKAKRFAGESLWQAKRSP